MKRFVIGGLIAAAFAVAGLSSNAWAQACANSGQICGKCNGGAGSISVQDARQGLLIAADVFGIIADVDDGFCDTDFDQDVDVNDARQILLKAADVFGLIDSCATGDQRLVVRVRTTDATAFGADARVNVPTGFDENAATGTPIGGATTVCDTNNTNCRIAAINPDSAGGTIRFGVATTLGFAQTTNRVGDVG
ncbi:MAG: hypothetical protein KC466_14550, partial [Myxococcales bacterium]|nr:hypothetical protein [Myxococcales bacterium]